MNQDNNIIEPANAQKLDEILSRYPMFDYRDKPVEVRAKTIEEIKAEFPMIDYDYGTAVYFSRKFPMLPNDAYEILAINHNKNLNQ